MMRLLSDVLLSRVFWAGNVIRTSAALLMIFGGIKMSMFIATSGEFLWITVLFSVACAVLGGVGMAQYRYTRSLKDDNMTTGQAPYDRDFLLMDVLCIVMSAAVSAIYGPSIVFHLFDIFVPAIGDYVFASILSASVMSAFLIVVCHKLVDAFIKFANEVADKVVEDPAAVVEAVSRVPKR